MFYPIYFAKYQQTIIVKSYVPYKYTKRIILYTTIITNHSFCATLCLLSAQNTTVLHSALSNCTFLYVIRPTISLPCCEDHPISIPSGHTCHLPGLPFLGGQRACKGKRPFNVIRFRCRPYEEGNAHQVSSVSHVRLPLVLRQHRDTRAVESPLWGVL